MASQAWRSQFKPQILPQNRGQANGHGTQTLTNHNQRTTSAFRVHYRPIKLILGSKEAEETNVLEFIRKVGLEGGEVGGVDVPGDGLWEKHNNLAMAGTLGSLENLSTLRHSDWCTRKAKQ